jgi:putative membrane protein
MGAVDVIPGVSGGTIAFISGIYDELLHSIKAVDVEAIQLLLKFRFADFWKKINCNFLVVVFAGIGTSILSLAKVVIFLLKQYPILIWSFFFGVIIISAALVLREI